MGRANNRTGFGKNRGAVNPPIHVGDTAPDSPVKNHIWIDTGTPALKVWNGLSWDTIAT